MFLGIPMLHLFCKPLTVENSLRRPLSLCETKETLHITVEFQTFLEVCIFKAIILDSPGYYKILLLVHSLLVRHFCKCNLQFV